MDAKVAVPFTDRESGRIYLAGDVYSGSEERVGELASRGHVETGQGGVPSKEWRLDRLQGYAAGLGLDAGSLRKKDDILALIAEAESAIG